MESTERLTAIIQGLSQRLANSIVRETELEVIATDLQNQLTDTRKELAEANTKLADFPEPGPEVE